MLRSAAILLALATVAAGCGGGQSTPDRYRHDFPPVGDGIVSLGQSVEGAVRNAGGSTDQRLASDFAGYARQLGDLQGRLRKLEPPRELRDEQDRLVSAMGGARQALEGISRGAASHDPKAARDATARLVGASEVLRAARLRLTAAVRRL